MNSRLRGFIILIAGVVLLILGLGMWESPEISWEGFLSAWSSVAKEIDRLIDDPFAVLGIIVLIIGLFIVVNGLRRIVRG